MKKIISRFQRRTYIKHNNTSDADTNNQLIESIQKKLEGYKKIEGPASFSTINTYNVEEISTGKKSAGNPSK